MTVVLKVVGLATGEASGAEGLYVETYTPDGYEGRGDAVLTSQLRRARRFRDSLTAIEYWRQTSATHPVRPDGQPNRPLTAFTVEVLPVDD